MGVQSTAGATVSTFDWSGASGSQDFSQPLNWSESAAPSGTVGSMSFPALPCAGMSCGPINDVSGLTVGALSIDDATGYTIAGNAIAIGAGGLTANTTSTTGPKTAPYLKLPVGLVADQTWSISGGPGGVGGLSLEQPVTGTARLGIDLSQRASLSLSADVGPVSIVGADSVHAGASAADNGLVSLGALNATEGNLNATGGQPISLTDAALLGPATLGPLNSVGGYLGLAAQSPPGNLTSTGSVTFDSVSALGLWIAGGTNPAPGQSYSQLAASGPITLGGAHLYLAGEGGACPNLTVGETDTLVSSSAGVTGTFAGLPAGADMALRCIGGTPPTVQINYTSNAVTATVVSNGAPYQTITLLTVAPRSAAAVGQSVKLTATVSSLGSPLTTNPAGTMSFYDNGAAIPGCTQLPLTGGAYIPVAPFATCTGNSAVAGTHNLAAAFTPTDPALWQKSMSAPQQFVVGTPSATGTRINTITRVRASVAPGAPELMVYTATITPTQASADVPAGQVAFLDNGATLPGCAAVALRDVSGSDRAMCTTPYQLAGPQHITASYSGDAGFAASHSLPVRVTSTVSVSAVRVRGATGPRPTLTLRVNSPRLSMSALTILMPAGFGFAAHRTTSNVTVLPHGARASVRTVGGRLVVRFAPAARSVSLRVGLQRQVPTRNTKHPATRPKRGSGTVYAELLVQYAGRPSADLMVAVPVD